MPKVFLMVKKIKDVLMVKKIKDLSMVKKIRDAFNATDASISLNVSENFNTGILAVFKIPLLFKIKQS